MAVQTLLSAVTSSGAGSGASHSGPVTVMVDNDSVFDGCTVAVEHATTDVAADYVPFERSAMRSAGTVNADFRGTYFLRGVVHNAGSATNVTLKSNQ